MGWKFHSRADDWFMRDFVCLGKNSHLKMFLNMYFKTLVN